MDLWSGVRGLGSQWITIKLFVYKFQRIRKRISGLLASFNGVRFSLSRVHWECTSTSGRTAHFIKPISDKMHHCRCPGDPYPPDNFNIYYIGYNITVFGWRSPVATSLFVPPPAHSATHPRRVRGCRQHCQRAVRAASWDRAVPPAFPGRQILRHAVHARRLVSRDILSIIMTFRKCWRKPFALISCISLNFPSFQKLLIRYLKFDVLSDIIIRKPPYHETYSRVFCSSLTQFILSVSALFGLTSYYRESSPNSDLSHPISLQ